MDLIEKAKCRGNLFLHKFDCGRRDLFSNYQRSFICKSTRKGRRPTARWPRCSRTTKSRAR
jgi:hypothetical protein